VVEDGANLDAHEKDYEEIQTENPANLRGGMVGQLMGGEVRLEDGRRVDEPKD